MIGVKNGGWNWFLLISSQSFPTVKSVSKIGFSYFDLEVEQWFLWKRESDANFDGSLSSDFEIKELWLSNLLFCKGKAGDWSRSQGWRRLVIDFGMLSTLAWFADAEYNKGCGANAVVNGTRQWLGCSLFVPRRDEERQSDRHRWSQVKVGQLLKEDSLMLCSFLQI